MSTKIYGIWCVRSDSDDKGGWMHTTHDLFYTEHKPVAAVKLNDISSEFSDIEYCVAQIGDNGYPIFEEADDL